MGKRTTNRITAILKESRQRVRRVAVFLCLAALVIAATAGVFHLTAIAKTHQKKVLSCTAQPHGGEGYAGYFVHTHNDDCYDENGNLVCPLPEIQAHEHSDSCYTTTRTLICTIPESDGHHHTADCYTRVRGELICGQEASEPVLDDAGNVINPGHQHTDECYSWRDELTCGKTEGEGAHHHTDACYESRTELTCREPVLHTHDDSCYENGVLVCGMVELTEHVHGPECFTVVEMTGEEVADLVGETTEEKPAEQTPSNEAGTGTGAETKPQDNNTNKENTDKPQQTTEQKEKPRVSDPNADVETAADWAQSFADVELTGHWGKDVVLMAESQLDYEESSRNFIIEDDGTLRGYTRYGAKYGVPYAAWDATFASFCIEYAEVPEWAFPLNKNTGLWVDALSKIGKFTFPQDYEPKAGDLIFFDDDEDGKPEHCGIVTAYGEDENESLVVLTIEGDRDASVKDYVYDADDSKIFGYARLPENPDAPVEETPEEEPVVLPSAKPAENPDKDNTETDKTGEETVGVSMPFQSFYGETADVAVYVEADEGTFPVGTYMTVTAVQDQTILDAAADAVKTEVNSLCAVDICFFNSKGEEIEPLLPIRVKMTSSLVIESEDTVVVHVDDEGTASQVENTETGVADVTFEADSFSVYVLVGTVIEKHVVTADGQNYIIHATFGPETGIPADAQLDVTEVLEDSSEYETYVAMTEDALGMEAGSAGYIRLFDISIVNKDDTTVKYQPAENTTVSVNIELADAESDSLSVVHFEDIEAPGDIIQNVETDGQIVSFAAEGFSVYAVVDDGSTENEARATVNFYGKNTSTPIATVYVKNSDTSDEIESIVFDPGCGELDSAKRELFDGWIISTVNTTDGSVYTIDTEGKTIEDIRAFLEALEIKEGDIVNIYAKIVRTILVSYQGEDDTTILGTVTLKVLGSDDPNNPDSIAEYVINMNYTPETATQAFMGWNVAEGADYILSAEYEGEPVSPPYVNGTKIRVNRNVTLSVNAPHGHWLVFDENGKGATYNAPVFIKDGETTSEPALAMTRLGYSFGGWYTDPGCTDGNEFTFGSQLTNSTTIYAKWIEASTANYTVIIWKERMSDTYAENGGTGEGKEKNYDFAESYTLVGTVGANANAVSNGTSSVVDGDSAGTRYYNARIQGTSSSGGNVNHTVSYTGYHCAGYDTGVEITPEGNSVINVYYDRNTVTYTFYTYGSSQGGGTWWLCKEDGTQIIKDGDRANRNTGITTSASSNDPYIGVVRYNDGRTYYYSTTGACGGTNMREAHWEFVSNSGSQWNVYQESTGLYGEKLNWPTDTSIWWYESHNNTSGTGTRMTYKDAFLPLDDDMTVEYWGNTSSASGTIHFWTQDVEGGDSYTDQVQVATGNANFNINDKFTGFYAYQYRTDNGQWQNVGTINPNTGIYGDPVSYNNRLDIRYNRIKAAITFLDGSYFDGNGNRLDETPQAEGFYTSPEYFYEADVRSYNKSGDNYYTPPEKTGYTFEGWFADDACTVPYNFNTMPATGITVYAKWVQNQYRVFLHPNVPESDTTLSWGSEDQDMTFRVSSGSKVSTPTGTRSEYKFIGWYLDEDCTQVFDGERYILTDTSVTTPYDKTTDMTDTMNKYGNIVGEGSNSDLTGYNGGERFWITRKLDLYAKWRAELIGADGIGIRYDANGGSNAPNDTNLYLDNTDTTAQGASTPPDNTQQFLYWVLQRWDDGEGKYVDIEEADNKIYPGESFTVLKSNALIEELEGSTQADPKYRYTIQLRAQYGPKDEPTPTHLTWYGNGGSAGDGTVSYTDNELQINEEVDIRQATTFTRPGYKFIGWAKVDSTTEGYTLSEKDLTEDDLFLKYENEKFYAQITEGSDEWTEVSKVAADERTPYHDIYAVWEKKTYTVTVIKVVDGFDADKNTPFTFTPRFAGMTEDDYTSNFQLVGNENGADDGSIYYNHSKEFVEVPYDTVFSITEESNSSFETSASYIIENADIESDNKTVLNVINGAEIVVKGDVVLTVTNTRKAQQIRVKKTELDNETPLGDAVFKVTVDGTEYILTSDSDDGYLKNDIFPDGIIIVPYGNYSLEETTPPAGYLGLENAVSVTVDESGLHATPFEVIPPEEDADYYTVIIPNNPGIVLPQTGGTGVIWIYLLGAAFCTFATVMIITTRRSKYTR